MLLCVPRGPPLITDQRPIVRMPRTVSCGWVCGLFAGLALLNSAAGIIRPRVWSALGEVLDSGGARARYSCCLGIFSFLAAIICSFQRTGLSHLLDLPQEFLYFYSSFIKWHTVQFSHLKCLNPWFLVYLQRGTNTATAIWEHSHHLLKYSVPVSSNPPLPTPGIHVSTSHVWTRLFWALPVSVGTSYKWSFVIASFT